MDSPLKINVLIPSYQCHEWIERCLDSVSIQSHTPHQVLVIDDASPDILYREQWRQECQRRGFMFQQNLINQQCPYNIWHGIQQFEPDPESVIFLLDGDDFLPDHTVFSRIAAAYNDSGVWLTYGNYQPYPHNTGQVLATAYPDGVIHYRQFRTCGYASFNHPLTFRRHLWDQIQEADLQNTKGEWFRGGYDFLIMIPMLEMAAPYHFKYLNDTLYMYNAVNPISDAIVNVNLVEESREIIHRPKKEQYHGRSL